jgi:hypothetical protein
MKVGESIRPCTLEDFEWGKLSPDYKYCRRCFEWEEKESKVTRN